MRRSCSLAGKQDVLRIRIDGGCVLPQYSFETFISSKCRNALSRTHSRMLVLCAVLAQTKLLDQYRAPNIQAMKILSHFGHFSPKNAAKLIEILYFGKCSVFHEFINFRVFWNFQIHESDIFQDQINSVLNSWPAIHIAIFWIHALWIFNLRPSRLLLSNALGVLNWSMILLSVVCRVLQHCAATPHWKNTLWKKCAKPVSRKAWQDSSMQKQLLWSQKILLWCVCFLLFNVFYRLLCTRTHTRA